MQVTYCWEIWYDDVFLGYEYADNDSTAIQNSIKLGGVASMYGQPAEKLTARKL
jgi:hypothetical protein